MDDLQDRDPRPDQGDGARDWKDHPSHKARSERSAQRTKEHKAKKAARKATDRHGKRWTAEDEKILRLGWGEFTVDTIARRLNRRCPGIRLRAQMLGLGSASSRSGLLSVYQVAARSGYAVSRVLAAVRRLGLKPKRRPRSDGKRSLRIGFDEDEVLRVEDFLRAIPDGKRLAGDPERETAKGEWGTGGKPPACTACRRSDRPHKGHGLCNTCLVAVRSKSLRWGHGRCLPACATCERSDSPARTHRKCARCARREFRELQKAKRQERAAKQAAKEVSDG